MGKADLHAHTRHDAWGDGNQTVEEIFRHVEEETDLDVFAITDHDSTDAARAALALHRGGGYRFDFLPGVEVTNQAGHLLCYFPQGEIVDIPSLRPFWWTVRYAHAHGAICIVAHPVYPPWLAGTLRRGLAAGERIEGIEAVNAGIPTKAQGRLHAVAAHFDLSKVGNSDAHHEVAIGAAHTLFPGRTAGDFLEALRAGQTEPVLAHRPAIDAASRRFTTRRSMTRPGWVRNLWREVRVSR
ncbi:MAG TPA: PHP-associated domain-containing protein [Chloroflexota bacterium]|nr:PHP-associated domain-containing protein [Chloroflexota bacterium]